MKLCTLICGCCALMALAAWEPCMAAYETATAVANLPYLAADPGEAVARQDGDELVIGNSLIEQRWSVGDGVLRNTGLSDKLNGVELEPDPEPFTIICTDGTVIPASELKLQGKPQWSPVTPGSAAPCLARRLKGQQVVLNLALPNGSLAATWRAVLLDGSNYIRHELVLKPQAGFSIAEIVMLDGTAEDLRPGGTCEGAPALAGNMFMGVEHPMSRNQAAVDSRTVAAWKPEQMHFPDAAETTWQLTGPTLHDGEYELEFQYTDGGHRLEISWAALYQDGRELARDEHFGATGIAHIENTYQFNVSGYSPAGGPVELRALTRADGGTDSTGVILLRDLSGTPRLRCAWPLGLTLEAGMQLELSSVVGVSPPGQMRRAFLYYLERERAHPYRTFLHYNSWYDIGYFSKYTEEDCLRVINAYKTELVDKRGVQLDSFLFDDGWDDYDSLWDFHEGFPEGFTNVGELTRSFGAGAGVWLSPWGGYGEPRQQRLAASEGLGYEQNEGGFALSGPHYYRRFSEICRMMISEYNVNQFKLDGLGRGTAAVPGSEFSSDFEAAISLISELRSEREDVFVNLTTGTWPSPFWLRIADSIWRSGWDHSYAGEGSDREQWLTYRDGETYRNISKSSPLYPLNSLMLHGVIYATHSGKLATNEDGALVNEIRSYFASGTQLQELYISPELMTEADWDELAAAANWAREHAVVLADSHWVGGDPYELEVYGWAAWHPTGATLALRNPSSKEQSITLKLGVAFELPDGRDANFELVSPYSDQRIQQITSPASANLTLKLQPFEVLVFSSTQGEEQ